MKLIKIRNR